MKNDIPRSTISRNTKNRLSKLCLAVFLLFWPVYAHATTGPECYDGLTLDALPPAVIQTRNDILTAAKNGHMLPMVSVTEQNEVWPVPDFNPNANFDQPPVYSWEAQSQGTQGVFILAQMIEILNLPYTKMPLTGGIDLYIWPHFAIENMSELCDWDKVKLLQIATPKDYLNMQKNGKYTGFQLAIGSDGTWHYFARKNISYEPTSEADK